jgi:hypothetical protein
MRTLQIANNIRIYMLIFLVAVGENGEDDMANVGGIHSFYWPGKTRGRI